MRGQRELYRDKIEVSLDGKQVFYLFFGAAVVACLVFVLGVMVGRRLEARAHADAAPSAQAASDPLAALDLLAAGDTPDDLSFPRELTRDEPDVAPAPAVADEPGGDQAHDKPEGAADDAAADDAGADDAAAAEKAAVEKAAADKRAAAEKAAADKRAAAEKAAADKRAAEEKAAAEKREAEKKAAATKANWTLQLSSFQDESEAQSFYNQLRESGYAPFITRAEVPDKGTWFRVRVGRYSDYDAALEAKTKFEASANIIAYVTRL